MQISPEGSDSPQPDHTSIREIRLSPSEDNIPRTVLYTYTSGTLQIILVAEKLDYPLHKIIYLEQYSIFIHQVHYRSY